MKHFQRLHRHIQRHHKKYLLWAFWWFAVVKLFLLLFSLSVVQYSITTNAQLESGCVYTGQYYTGEYQTWGYWTGEYQTWWYYAGCTTLPAYRSGWSLNESWEQVGGELIPESQTWCEFTGRIMTWGFMTGYYMTWGYRTWGTIVCNQWLGTGNVVQTWNNQQQNNILWNGICESGDVLWNIPISWSIVRNIFSLSWSYSWNDCLSSGLFLQLRDHNNQWISLWSVSWTTTYTFDSRRLYSFQQSGLYSLVGNTWAGNFYLYTGTYSGTYSHFYSWYMFRLLNSNMTPIVETSLFTIDNKAPLLTWVSLFSVWSASWYLNKSGLVTLYFTASEELSGVQVTLWSGFTPSTSLVSWLLYTYTRNVSSLYPDGVLSTRVNFSDKAWNTWSLSYMSSLVVDTTKPVITGFVFGEYAGGLRMQFVSSEPVNYVSNYRKTSWNFVSWNTGNYLTAHYMYFSWLLRDQLYQFNLYVYDKAGNTRSVTGDVVRTNLWVIISHVFIAPIVDGLVLSGSLSRLAVVLKAEVTKFNSCKQALTYTPVELTIKGTTFVLQMPTFKKSQVKTLVNAFTLFVLDKLKHSTTITSDEVVEVTKKFDNFLIVLKLLRDDENSCKQNLSNYHISQFKRALFEYGIELE